MGFWKRREHSDKSALHHITLLYYKWFHVYHCISTIVVLMKDSWWWNSSNYIGRKLLSKSWYQGPCCLTVQCKFFLLSGFDQYVALNLDLASLFAARSAVEFGSKDSKTWVAWQKTWLWALIIDFKTGFL